jgi:predicted GIY-YIG superfamily endonuclease
MNHEEVLAPPTPSGSASSSSNASPMSVSEIGQETLSAVASAETSVGHVHDLVYEAVRPAKQGLFASLAGLLSEIYKRGRDAFVGEVLAKHGSNPDLSRQRKDGDKDGVIYAITCLLDNKIYVGKTNNFDARMGEHLRGCGNAPYLANAIKQHGRENFVPVILLAGIEELNSTEIAVIKHLDCLVPGNMGYNIHPGGSEMMVAITSSDPPPDHERLALEAMTVMTKMNGLHTLDFSSLFDCMDRMRAIFNRLKPSEDPDFRFQRDDQPGGMIYWRGMYRKWFYLLRGKNSASNSPEKTYLNVLYPGKKSSDSRRKFWVAMDNELRGDVLHGKMRITEAMDAATAGSMRQRGSGRPLKRTLFPSLEVPPDHERLALEAMAVIEQINGLHNRNFICLFDNIDMLQRIFDKLKPTDDPEFQFQRDRQYGGMIYWQGRYRKWLYLLHKKKAASDVPEKKYLNLLFPGKKSCHVIRKFWVAMDFELRSKVMYENMPMIEAMDEATSRSKGQYEDGRPAIQGLFPSLAVLLAEIDSLGRDAFVAELVRGSTPDFSRTRKNSGGVVYSITCLVDGKIYIGQTNDIHTRMRKHFTGRGSTRLTNAINVRGPHNFVSTILLTGIDRLEDLNMAEISVIKSLDCMTNSGYNIRAGGRGAG